MNIPRDDDSPRPPAAAENVGPDPIAGQTGLPPFVGELIHGTFEAVVDASVQQMQSYADLARAAGRSVDPLTAESVTDDDARGWLAARWSDALVMDPAGSGEPSADRLRVRAADGGAALGGISRELELAPPVVDLAGDAEERRLVTAARTRLVNDRQQQLATMVLMGINRVS